MSFSTFPLPEHLPTYPHHQQIVQYFQVGLSTNLRLRLGAGWAWWCTCRQRRNSRSRSIPRFHIPPASLLFFLRAGLQRRQGSHSAHSVQHSGRVGGAGGRRRCHKMGGHDTGIGRYADVSRTAAARRWRRQRLCHRGAPRPLFFFLEPWPVRFHSGRALTHTSSRAHPHPHTHTP